MINPPLRIIFSHSKDGGVKTRLIFHLSYPRVGGKSVNSEIPKDLCTVVYPDFESAIRLCQSIGKSSGTIFLSKSDMSAAFRNLPMMVRDFMLLLMKAEHPDTGLTYYFVD